jgi:hypothetical protein
MNLSFCLPVKSALSSFILFLSINKMGSSILWQKRRSFHACMLVSPMQEYVSGLDHRFKQLRARAHTHRWSVDLRYRAVLVRSMNASRSHELSFPPFSSLRITGGTSLCAGEEPEKVTLGRERATTNLDLSVNEYREACAACTQTIFFFWITRY